MAIRQTGEGTLEWVQLGKLGMGGEDALLGIPRYSLSASRLGGSGLEGEESSFPKPMTSESCKNLIFPEK